MKDQQIEPLDAEFAALLDAERRATVDPAALDRVWTRVALPLPAIAGATGSTRSWLASHAMGVAAVSFVAGGLSGAAVYAAAQKPAPERIVYVERSVPVAARRRISRATGGSEARPHAVERTRGRPRSALRFEQRLEIRV